MTDPKTNLPVPIQAGQPAENTRQRPDLAALAREHPGLTLAGGIAAGLLIGALLPKRAGSKLARRAVGAAAVAGELGMALGKQTRDTAVSVSREGRERIVEGAGAARQQTARSAQQASDLGLKLARAAVDIARNRAR